MHCLSQKHAVCHELKNRGLRSHVFKTDQITDLQLTVQIRMQ